MTEVQADEVLFYLEGVRFLCHVATYAIAFIAGEISFFLVLRALSRRSLLGVVLFLGLTSPALAVQPSGYENSLVEMQYEGGIGWFSWGELDGALAGVVSANEGFVADFGNQWRAAIVADDSGDWWMGILDFNGELMDYFEFVGSDSNPFTGFEVNFGGSILSGEVPEEWAGGNLTAFAPSGGPGGGVEIPEIVDLVPIIQACIVYLGSAIGVIVLAFAAFCAIKIAIPWMDFDRVDQDQLEKARAALQKIDDEWELAEMKREASGEIDHVRSGDWGYDR